MRFWEYLLLAVACCVAVVMVVLGRRRGSRFLWALSPRLALAVAIALSYFPQVGCQAQGQSQATGQPADPSPAETYAELGRVWREITSYTSGTLPSQEVIQGLEQRMKAALAAAEASPGLCALFEDRFAHMERLTATCYEPVPPGYFDLQAMSRFDIEKQLAAIEALRASGDVPAVALAKAEAALAASIELRRRAGAIAAQPGEEQMEAGQRLRDQYQAGELQPSAEAAALAETAVELTTGTYDGEVAAGPIAGFPDVDDALSGIWHQISRHASGETEDAGAYAALREQMTATLEASQASQAVVGLFEDRYEHVFNERYRMATCYEMSYEGVLIMRAEGDIQTQVAALEELAGKGAISPEAAGKARAAIAAALELLRQSETTTDPQELEQQYEQGKLEASEGSVELATEAVSLTAEGAKAAHGG